MLCGVSGSHLMLFVVCGYVQDDVIYDVYDSYLLLFAVSVQLQDKVFNNIGDVQDIYLLLSAVSGRQLMLLAVSG